MLLKCVHTNVCVAALATLRDVVSILRAQLARILGTELPSGVEGVRGVTHDSRLVEPGFAFVAIPGFQRDGTEFVPEALGRGAALVVAERGLPPGVPAVVVPDSRAALAALARAVFGEPSAEMSVYGVTGTNGKTTTSYALYSILAAHTPEKCGLMTTAEVLFANERRRPARTTPEATEVQGTLREMLDAGVEQAVLEVSSHGVALKRVTGTRFAGALFTNLTRDHLDLHGSMEEYYRAKRELFHWVGTRGPKLANADDSYGRRIAEEIPGVKTFGVAEDADYRVERVRSARGGTAFLLHHPKGILKIESPLLGRYNVENVAGATALALALGVGEEVLSRAVREMGQVPGRFERIVVPGRRFGFEVIVDYAHTDVALEAALSVARGVADAGGGRVLCVFGAAGDRDVAKRPLMGRVASNLAEASIITTDDAYTEDPEKIAREVAAGSEGGRYEVVLDRREAIQRALKAAQPGDVVVVAGKGHERVQHLPGGDVPFHDASVVRELLEELEREDD